MNISNNIILIFIIFVIITFIFINYSTVIDNHIEPFQISHTSTNQPSSHQSSHKSSHESLHQPSYEQSISESISESISLPILSEDATNTLPLNPIKNKYIYNKPYDINPKSLNISNSVQYPNSDDIIKYDMIKCDKKSSLSSWSPYKNVVYSDKDIVNVSECGPKGALINDKEWNPDEFYKKYQEYVKTYFEDPMTRGYNVGDFSNYAGLYNIGKISLKKTVEYAKPDGYIFNGSASYLR